MLEAYKISVAISLTNHVSKGLALMSSQFAKTEGQAALLQKRLDNIKSMAIRGGIFAGLGVAGLSLFKGPLEEAKLFQSEVARFTALGLGDVANKQAVKFATGMNIMGSSARDNMKLLKEATTITGSLQHAMEIAPLLTKMKFGISGYMGDDKGSAFDTMFQAVLKTTELRGALVDRKTGQIDTENFTRVANLMTKAYVASGGLVKPQDYLAAIKTGGVSTKLMNDEAFFYGLGHFMQESGGSRTGTASMSMFQNWAMGRMPQRVAERMAKIGLLNQSSIHYGSTGHITGVDPMGIIKAKEFVDNPYKYVNDVVVPLLKSKGFKDNSLNIELASLLGIRTASNLADQFVREQKVADNYIERAKRADGIVPLYNLVGGTLDGKEIDLQAKWSNVMLQLGNTILPLAIRGIEKLTVVLQNASTWIEKNKDLVKGLALAFGALSATLILRGSILLITAAFSGLGLALQFTGTALLANPIGLALTGIAVAGLLIYKNWDKVKPYWDSLWNVIKAIGYWIKDNFTPAWVNLKNALMPLFGMIKPLVDLLGSKNPELNTLRTGATNPTKALVSAVGTVALPLYKKEWDFLTNWANKENAKHEKEQYVKPAQSMIVTVNAQMNVDKDVLGKYTGKYLAKQASKPASGITSFDPSQMQMHPNYNIGN